MTEGPVRSVALALPAFRAAVGANDGGPPSLPGAEWLASRGRRTPAWRGEWRAWLLSHFGPGADALQRCPAGASVRALDASRRDDGCWGCAEPVHLLVGLDHLRLAPRATLALSAEDGRALATSLDAALAGSGFSLHYVERGPWLLECRTDIECETLEPAVAEGRDVRDSLPTGQDGARIRQLTNELQMLLHEHPVNARRGARGLPPVNSIWLWGFGRAGQVSDAYLPVLCTDDAWLSGLWCLHGAEARPLADAGGVLAAGTTMLIAAADSVGDPAGALERWDAELCAPLVSALRRGRTHRAEVLMGETPYTISRAARFAVWRRGRPWSELLA